MRKMENKTNSMENKIKDSTENTTNNELGYMTDEMMMKSIDTPKKKLQYFWDYYKWHVIIPVLILLFVVFGIRTFLMENRETSVYISMINCKDEYSVDEYLTAYSDELQERGETQETFRLEGGFIHPEVVDEMTAADSMVTASIQRYQAEVISKRSEAVIASDWVVREYAAADAYCDLTTVLSEQQLEELGDQLLYCKNMEGEEIVAGVYLKSSLFVDAYEGNPPVFAIASYLENKTIAVKFLMHCAK